MSVEKYIEIKGARVNNLKNVHVCIPRNKLVVVTGLSGSGKSSLAFDTLYAEGQRRYVESLSAYARQFLGRIDKPEVDFIRGIPPAIAIEQKVNTRNPRSTVGTSTEVYDYLRMLYARIGKTFSPLSGELVKKHRVEDVVEYVQRFPEDTRLYVMCPVVLPEGRSLAFQLEMLMKQGFNRLEVSGVTYRMEDLIQPGNTPETPVESSVLSECSPDALFLLIDRLTVQNDQQSISRLTDSVETAFYEGQNVCCVRIFLPEEEILKFFSKQFEADGMLFEEPTDELFSFNSPTGACPVCEGFGKVIGIDENLVVPNKSLSIFDEAVFCWRGEKMCEWKDELVQHGDQFGFPIFRPWYQLTNEEKKLVWTGNAYFRGLNAFFAMLEENQYKIQYRVMLARYRGKTVCPECGGTRLKKQASYVRVGGVPITWLVDMPIYELVSFFDGLELNETERAVSKRLLVEIKNRIRFLMDVGLGYLTLNRLSSSLSGGESQRINLATSLGSSLVGSLYILDEPSIGLHSRDTQLLINVLRQLQALGNTVVVVEHDEEIMRAADYLVDMGPDAGRLGGEVVYQGDVAGLVHASEGDVPWEGMTRSHTLRYLTGAEQIAVPSCRRSWNNYIEVVSVRQNNLKGIDVKFPLNVLTVVTGVSGSGKSSLVRDVFYSAVKRYYGGATDRAGLFGELKGDLHLVSDIDFVDQNPIGRSSRSNPVTYLKAYDEIRKLFAEQTLSKQMGYSASYFSFNVAGGRCEECEGEGTVTVEMQFMADLVLPCEVCHGKRFKQDILDVLFCGKSISDVLDMTVDQAIDFFGSHATPTGKRIIKKLKPLQDVGLGYIKLGQSSSTLSGGESQRVKLAYFLSAEHPSPTVYVFDEPTTGLHFHDIRILLQAFDALIAKGHTVVVIEHNMEVIKNADHVIDLGPEGGDKGGYLVFEGTPEGLIQCPESHTGRYLKAKLRK